MKSFVWIVIGFCIGAAIGYGAFMLWFKSSVDIGGGADGQAGVAFVFPGIPMILLGGIVGAVVGRFGARTS